MNIYLFFAALVGFSSVLLGSYGEHSLRDSVDAEMFKKFMTGLRYHQNYSVILLFLALLNYSNINPNILCKTNIAFWIFLFATLTFCASVYLFVISNSKLISYIAPIGGISLMFAWLYLLYLAFQK